jgi:hypothetical protein
VIHATLRALANAEPTSTTTTATSSPSDNMPKTASDPTTAAQTSTSTQSEAVKNINHQDLVSAASILNRNTFWTSLESHLRGELVNEAETIAVLQLFHNAWLSAVVAAPATTRRV